jgi:kinesin family protein 4/21/27
MDEATGALESARAELSESVATVNSLKGTVKELELINEETIKELQKVSQKERKSSRLVQELEDQLNQNYDQHEAATNRLSALQTERSQELQDVLSRKYDLEKEVEESRIKIALLEVSV